MTDYFDIEYRKKCRKKLVEYLYELLIRTNIPHPILAFVIKACHFLISYITILLVIFAPLVILVQITNSSNEMTLIACQAYFYARLAHFVIYSLGIPYIKTITFCIGFIAQMVLAYTLLM